MWDLGRRVRFGRLLFVSLLQTCSHNYVIFSCEEKPRHQFKQHERFIVVMLGFLIGHGHLVCDTVSLHGI